MISASFPTLLSNQDNRDCIVCSIFIHSTYHSARTLKSNKYMLNEAENEINSFDLPSLPERHHTFSELELCFLNV